MNALIGGSICGHTTSSKVMPSQAIVATVSQIIAMDCSFVPKSGKAPMASSISTTAVQAEMKKN